MTRPDDGGCGPDRGIASRVSDGIIHFEDRYYILASAGLADDRGGVLKQGETFAVFDRRGDIRPIGLSDEGIYHEGTRHLNALRLRLGDERPLLLSSTVDEDNAQLEVNMTNPDMTAQGDVRILHGTVHLVRSHVLWGGTCCGRLRVRNYGAEPFESVLAVDFSADFADVFEVRGVRRERRGLRLDAEVSPTSVRLGYRGLDGVVRRTTVRFDPEPVRIEAGLAELPIRLGPGEEAVYELTITCSSGDAPSVPVPYDIGLERNREELSRLRAGMARIETSNELFNDWLNRCYTDLFMMISDTPGGPYPYAGIPWYSAPFGRDGILTAFSVLAYAPEMARGVLDFLAATQADAIAHDHDAEPGKVLHEARGGEMAALGEIPFGRYYGSIDATPLFVWLASAYLERTGDFATVHRLWPHIEKALAWIEESGDRDGDGFVEYQRRTPAGLEQQGWKDSHDSVFHADGGPAPPPIALCEVQGYVYAAKRGAARIAEHLRMEARADDLRDQARALRSRFESAFWLEDLGTYALALDGEKRPCRVRTSNAGHCLAAGIARPDRARRVAETLLSKHSDSGWGIRTLDDREARYNPMAYHNGSVWPHDNAVIARGFARYGLRQEAIRVLTALFDASLFMDLHRLPELFCGFPRRRGTGPTLYPVACSPQAWSSAAVFLLLQSVLGLRVQGSRVRFRHPALPPSLDTVRILDLRAGTGQVDLELRRHHDHSVGVNVLRKIGRVSVGVVS